MEFSVVTPALLTIVAIMALIQAEDIDECASDPCQNGGECSDGMINYTCACRPGYSGTNCQTDIDECASDPCQNGGECSDGIINYTCACRPGYSGTNCETDIDECVSNPCQNGGGCRDGINNYTCTCKPGYSDKNCQTDIDECASNPCQNGGWCSDGINNYTCACKPGYGGGKNCQTGESKKIAKSTQLASSCDLEVSKWCLHFSQNTETQQSAHDVCNHDYGNVLLNIDTLTYDELTMVLDKINGITPIWITKKSLQGQSATGCFVMDVDRFATSSDCHETFHFICIEGDDDNEVAMFAAAVVAGVGIGMTLTGLIVIIVHRVRKARRTSKDQPQDPGLSVSSSTPTPHSTTPNPAYHVHANDYVEPDGYMNPDTKRDDSTKSEEKFDGTRDGSRKSGKEPDASCQSEDSGVSTSGSRGQEAGGEYSDLGVDGGKLDANEYEELTLEEEQKFTRPAAELPANNTYLQLF